MKHLKAYELLESSGKNINNFSAQKYKSITGNDSAPGFTGWIYGLLQSMQSRFDNMDSFFKSSIYMKGSGGQTIDTGLGWLLGTAGSLATGVLSKIFEPSVFISRNQNSGSGEKISQPGSETEVKTEHLRVMNDKFKKNDLQNITSDSQMQDYIENSYKQWGVAPGQSAAADELIATNANTYYNKSKGYSLSSQARGAASVAANFIPAGRIAKLARAIK